MDNDTYKLYLNDTGILNYLIGSTSYQILFDGDYSYKGVIVENYVATELSKMDDSLFYWSRKGKNQGTAEVDFIIQEKEKIIPVEVKAGMILNRKV